MTLSDVARLFVAAIAALVSLGGYLFAQSGGAPRPKAGVNSGSRRGVTTCRTYAG